MIEQARIFADGERKGIRLYVEHDTSVDDWIREKHYLHSTPAGAILRLCFKDENGRVIGCMMWGAAYKPKNRSKRDFGINAHVLYRRHAAVCGKQMFRNGKKIYPQALRNGKRAYRLFQHRGRTRRNNLKG